MKSVIVFVIISSSYIQLTVASGCNDCLLLTPHIKAGNISLAKKLSEVDSAEYFGIQSYSGFITVKEQYNSNLFFWYFPLVGRTFETPWIIWLQGGPGVSSMMGLFEIIGPLKIVDGKVQRRSVTWATNYSMLFIDNPVGAGYSFTEDDRGYPDNEDDIGAQLLKFLLQFLQMFPDMRLAPLFIVGQSYAGKYVPALGIQIHRFNHKKFDQKINLRGIAIGNGLIELRNMMHYSDFCRDLGLLDGNQLGRLKMMEEDVVELIDNKLFVEAANKFNETIEYIKKTSGVSVYNFMKDPTRDAPPFEAYINSDDVRRLIHVGDAEFDYNNQHVYNKMLPDVANSTRPFVEELLEHYGVLSYSGQLDIILPYALAKHMYATLNWSHRQDYDKAVRRRLRRHANGAVVGYKKSGGNFVEVLIRGAGHSVPVDQPDVAMFIIDTFISDYT